ncbi:MAG: phage baseplate assembly protein V [Acidimicrobiales bacterium]
MDRFPGKYVGIVVDNDDPKGLSRIRAQVPEILIEETTGWCLPSAVFAGPGVGLAVVPPIGGLVFVEWPAGDVTRQAIWSGGLWADGDGVDGAGPDAFVLVTPGGHRVELRDTSGDEAIEVSAASGAVLVLDSKGVTVSFGGQKLEMTNSGISINDGALEVI